MGTRSIQMYCSGRLVNLLMSRTVPIAVGEVHASSPQIIRRLLLPLRNASRRAVWAYGQSWSFQGVSFPSQRTGGAVGDHHLILARPVAAVPTSTDRAERL